MPFTIGIGILLFFLVVAILAPYISPYDPNKLGVPYAKPSREHLLGCNDIGQDILSELLYGTRVSMLVGILSAIIVTIVGAAVGLVSGYYKGGIDTVIMGVTSVAMAIPSLPLTIVLAAYMHTSLWNIIIAICITAWVDTARIVRSRVLQIREMPFIKIAKAQGAEDKRILFVHILPNVIELLFIRGALAVSSSMLTEAGLSFLGLGVIGQKSWGAIIHYAFFRNGVLNGYWWWYLPPILCISTCVLGFVLLGYYEKETGKNVSRRYAGIKEV